jgi:hypothetical protein
VKALLVSHTHWDREWYRTFQGFRARLVDTVDHVLDLIQDDPGFRFVLDGQTVVLEDYLEIRPERRGELEGACRAGRIAIGPWYIQPDSILPSGEAHVRNLLEGRRVGSSLGRVSEVAYTPDSFGHPAQFPQIFSGFGLRAFVYWRGAGEEFDELPSEYRWVAPDGSSLLACQLPRAYFGAAMLPRDPELAVTRARELATALAERTRSDCVLLMNGIDHAGPDPHIREVAAALASETGWEVVRGSLDDFAASIAASIRDGLPQHCGELLGARVAPLLPGTWSTWMPLKLRNRRCEQALEGVAEPWCAVGRVMGLPDERPALRTAWRALLLNQAHDSICGCSVDPVHAQMASRYDQAEELASETTRRVLERMAGLPLDRTTPLDASLDLAVFNPSPYPRTEVARFELDPFPAFAPGSSGAEYHPLLLASREGAGFRVNGEPARVVPGASVGRFLMDPAGLPLDVEFVARDVPAFGWRRVRLEQSPPIDDAVDEGREIATDGVGVTVANDATLTVRFGDRSYSGLGAIEDKGDRGDTYDADLLEDDALARASVATRRRRHPSGIQQLEVTRTLRLPLRLSDDRESRSAQMTDLRLVVEARVAAGIERVDLRVRLDNTVEDHRLRLLFPTHTPTTECVAASTFDVVTRSLERPEAKGWVHAAPRTFPHQGWVSVNDLTVVAAGLPEAEVWPDGTIALTLVRAVGWLSRVDLRTRPGPAGPALRTPGAQCLGSIDASLSLLPGLKPAAARDAQIGLCAVAAGPDPLVAPGVDLIRVEPDALLLSALKPPEAGEGVLIRLLNPTEETIQARVHLGFPISEVTSVRLDETPLEDPRPVDRTDLRLEIPAKALRSLLLR